MAGVNKRVIEVGADTCLLGFSGRNYIKSAVFDASTLAPVGGVNEVQTATITGVPTGGNFKLKYRGQTTAAIQFNDTGATVQTLLRALSNIGATGVTVTGAAGGPYVVTFTGNLAAQDVYMLQLTANLLTGGTAPSVSIAQTTQGVSADPRILVGSPTLPGTIVTKTGTTPDKIKEYTGSGSIWGIVDGVEEFISTVSPLGDRDIPVYVFNCVFNTNKIKNSATYSAALTTWANANFNRLEAV